MEHSVLKENNQGPKKNRIPAALKRDQNTKTRELTRQIFTIPGPNFITNDEEKKGERAGSY